MATEKSVGNNENEVKQDLTDTMITAMEKDVLGELGNMCMGTCATTLSTLLGKRVNITTPTVRVDTGDSLFDEYDRPFIFTEVAYTEGLDGNNVFILKKDDALLITRLLMGGDESTSEDDVKEFYLSAMSEVMNQMVGSSATAMAETFHKTIGISTPTVREIDLSDQEVDPLIKDKTLVFIKFKMEIEDMLESSIYNLMPVDFAQHLVQLMLKNSGVIDDDEPVEEKPAEETMQKQTPPVQVQEAPSVAPTPQPAPTQAPAPTPRQAPAAPSQAHNERPIDLKTAKFQSFNGPDDSIHFGGQMKQKENIDLIMDVPLIVTVVLGRSKKSIKEILELGKGSVIVLDRLAGEMVDVLVNGKLFARGEVVVIDDSYGVRITELISNDYITNLEERIGKQVLLGMDDEM